MRRSSLASGLLLVVATICVININGFLYMLLDKEQLVSLVLLVGCVGLLVCTRFNVPRNALIYSTLVALFLLFSLLFTLLRGREFSLELLLGPIGNVIIVCAVVPACSGSAEVARSTR